MAINIWPAVSYLIDKVPFERILVRPRDNRKDMMELYEILKTKPAGEKKIVVEKPKETNHPAFINEEPVEEPVEGEYHEVEERKPKVHLERHEGSISNVSTAETVAYQNREIGKVLLQLERHAAQKFTIAGKKCDCGQSRHLLDLESLAEESMSMVDNPAIYNKVLDYVKDLGPKVTIEALESGKYDTEYASFVQRARDLRKELMGTLDSHALFPDRERVTPIDVVPDKSETEVPEDQDTQIKANDAAEKAYDAVMEGK
jgi:hypothetical protein